MKTEREKQLETALADAKAWVLECYAAWAPPFAAHSIITTQHSEDMMDRMGRINLALQYHREVKDHN